MPRRPKWLEALDGAIFLDVGAHKGQTLREVIKPRYGFKRIYAFEPMPREFAQLTAKYDSYAPRVQLCNYGLADTTGRLEMIGTNDLADASLLPNHHKSDQSVRTKCAFMKASSFFRRHISKQDTVVMKLNVEGSEIAILNNLIESGQIWKVRNVMIDFDIRRVFTGMEHLEQEMMDRLDNIGFNRYFTCEGAMVGPTHQKRIAHWLEMATGVI